MANFPCFSPYSICLHTAYSFSSKFSGFLLLSSLPPKIPVEILNHQSHKVGRNRAKRWGKWGNISLVQQSYFTDEHIEVQRKLRKDPQLIISSLHLSELNKGCFFFLTVILVWFLTIWVGVRVVSLIIFLLTTIRPQGKNNFTTRNNVMIIHSILNEKPMITLLRLALLFLNV